MLYLLSVESVTSSTTQQLSVVVQSVHAVGNTSLNFIGTSNFTHNWTGFGGGAINIVENVVLTFYKTSNFFNNSGEL